MSGGSGLGRNPPLSIKNLAWPWVTLKICWSNESTREVGTVTMNPEVCDSDCADSIRTSSEERLSSIALAYSFGKVERHTEMASKRVGWACRSAAVVALCVRSEEHTSELQSRLHLVCRLLLE